MTATIHPIFDAPDADHLDASARQADQAVWWQQQLANARFALERSDLHSDDELRDACATLQSRWGDATDYCMADAMIHTLNERDRMRRHADAKAETSRDVLARVWRETPPEALVLYIGVGAVVLLKLTGWL